MEGSIPDTPGNLTIHPLEVRRMRKCCKLTRDQLADRLGVSRWAVKSWEIPVGAHNHRKMPKDKVLSLFNLYRESFQ